MYDLTVDDAGRAQTFLEKTDHEYAEAKTEVDRLYDRRKTIMSAQKEISQRKSNADREDDARTSNAYQEASDEYYEVLLRFNVLVAQRSSAESRIRLFQTIESSRRKS